ncbi:putative Zn-dependent peptidase [Pullulanibacillus pueri]|uniref:Putative inactive metalloprotease YmfF n=1 Tax=Pullulanibacillus pueri TaxID=1437324 RepID=A0A8J3EMT1_9BACL|nr:pitrilysin family protein [Pullulanibacillus pueri]MBM7682536.1 putative Zn-dependent peptidase [Pullulanibacillus pueri]GGH82009.1 putative inactive metalloprotease YmfF [Pullulanibacillus pueri]
MSYIDEHIHALPGFTLHTVATNKFKTVTMVIQFRAPLEEETVTKRALLAHLLKSSTKQSPTSQQLQQRLDDLYGATLSSQVQKKGNNHLLSLHVHVANERFISETSSLLEESIQLLSEAILQPNVEGHAFDEVSFKKEKRALKQRLLAIYDDKMRYANERLIDEMCEGEVYALHTNGTLDALESLTSEELYTYYQDMLKTNEIDLYVVGDIDHQEMKQRIGQVLTFNNRETVKLQNTFEPVVKRQAKVVKESQEVEQGKLNLGYRTNVTIDDPLYPATQVFNGLFGGFPHSKLFMNVREKMSLAYYATSRYESFKGLLIVMSGIEFVNYQKAVDIIAAQLKAIQEGDFTEGEVAQTKALLKNSILEALDSPFGLIDVLYQKVLSNHGLELDQWFAAIEKVDRDEIIKAAHMTTLDTTYFLQGQEG